MKILYLLDDFPYPPDNGIRIKQFNIVSQMASAHECHLLCFCSGGDPRRTPELLANAKGLRILGIFSPRGGPGLQVGRIVGTLMGRPMSLATKKSRAFAMALRKSLCETEYDVIHVDGLGLAQYLHLCRSKAVVWSTTDAVSLRYQRDAEAAEGIRRAYMRFQSWTIRRLERSLLPKVAAAHVVSPHDCQYLSCLSPKSTIVSIPQGLTGEAVRSHNELGSDVNSHRLLFLGTLNDKGVARGFVEFLDRAYPEILRRLPDVELIAVGRCSSDALIRKLRAAPHVQFNAWVEDYGGEITKSSVVVITDAWGTGIKNRVLHAMALGKPVLGSAMAFEGMPVQSGVHCVICRSSGEFARAATSLLSDQALRADIGNAARSFVHREYSLEDVGARFDRLYRRAAAKVGAPAKFRGAPIDSPLDQSAKPRVLPKTDHSL